MTTAEQLRADWQPELDRAIEEAVVGPTHRWMSATYVIDQVAKRHGVATADVVGPRRSKHLVAARVDVYRVLRVQGWSYPAIGKALGRDHSSVLQTLRAHEGKRR